MARTGKIKRADIFAARLKKLRSAMKGSAGHRECPRHECLLLTDLANIRYLTGFTGSSARVVLTARGAWFFTDFRYDSQARVEIGQRSGFKIVILKKGWIEGVAALILRLKRESLSFEENFLTYGAFRELKRALGGVRLKPVSGLVEKLRLVKDPLELKELGKAIEIADAGFKEAARLIRRCSKGLTELDVCAAIERVLKKKGAIGPSFDIIVASGARSALPHGIASGKRIKKGELVIVDMGSLYKGYHSDATRTYITGAPTKRQLKIYDLVRTAHDLAISSIRPGVKAADIDRAARDHIERAGFGKYFGHGTGHGTGLNIHEGPSISPKSKDVVEQGMVFTIEPGIYVPGFGGVRIEDMVLVTNDGAEVLTKASQGV